MNWFGLSSPSELRLNYIEQMIAALVLGANFRLKIQENAELPLSHLLALAENGSDFWRISQHLYPEIDMAALLSSRIPSEPQPLHEWNDLGRLLLRSTSGAWLLRKEALENAKLVAVNLKAFRVKVMVGPASGSKQWKAWKATLLNWQYCLGKRTAHPFVHRWMCRCPASLSIIAHKV